MITLTFTNSPDGSLLIRKVCAVNPSVTLQNAEFKVTYSDGTLIGDSNGIFVTDENGEILITGLTPSKSVVVTEIKAPPGFIIDTQSQTIQIKEGRIMSLTFKNQPKGSLIIQKRDSATGKPLPGAEFRITTAAGCEVGLDGVIGSSTLTSNGIFTTDAQGEIRISNLAPGAYVITEIKAPDGYVIDSPSTNVVIGTGGDTQTVIVKNSKAGNLIIEKRDSVTGKPLEGVEFELRYADGSYVDNGSLSSLGKYYTNKNGQIIISGITGVVVVTEVKTIPGYVIHEETRSQTVQVNANDTQKLTFYNDPIGGLTIIKKDEETGERIKGVQFELRKLNGEIIGVYTTDQYGVIYLPEVEKGWYQAVELKAAKGYQLDDTPHRIEVKDGQTATLEITNRRVGSIVIHKIDSVTGQGISGVKFLLSDVRGNPIGVYESDSEGYVFVDKELADGRYTIREIECAEGYILDTQPKTVYVEYGGCTTVTWENTPATGQIQVYKYAAEYNEATGTPAGAPLEGAIYEISEARSGKVVDYITTDARGVAASKPLPLGRYKITEVTAPAYWQLSGAVFDETLEYSGQIIKLSDYDKPVKLGVTITKRGNAEVLASSQMRYDITVANTSNVALENFHWHDRIPTDAVRAAVLTTGTYSAQLSYRVLYKTNYTAAYQVLASNLTTTSNYGFNLSAIPMQAGEYVTDIYFDFGKVPVGFQSVVSPTLTVQVLGTVANNYQIVNRADVGGQYQDVWLTAPATWVTVVRRLTPGITPTLPKTGY